MRDTHVRKVGQQLGRTWQQADLRRISEKGLRVEAACDRRRLA
jgi:hypothetical protein